MGFGIFRGEFVNMQLGMSTTTRDRSSVTSVVMLTSLSSLGGAVLMGLATRMEGCLPGSNAFWSDFSAMGRGGVHL